MKSPIFALTVSFIILTGCCCSLCGESIHPGRTNENIKGLRIKGYTRTALDISHAIKEYYYKTGAFPGTEIKNVLIAIESTIGYKTDKIDANGQWKDNSDLSLMIFEDTAKENCMLIVTMKKELVLSIFIPSNAPISWIEESTNRAK